MALQIAIVEDLQPDAQRLQALVRQELGAVECGIFPSGDAYLQQMPARKDDLVFLDICMEGTSGIETAQQLRRADPEVLIVFVTSSPEYVWDAFPVHPFDYLLKPYEEEKFRKLAAELRRVLCRTEPELEVRIARQTVQLPLRSPHRVAAAQVPHAMQQNHIRVVSDAEPSRAVCVRKKNCARRKLYRPTAASSTWTVAPRLRRPALKCRTARPPRAAERFKTSLSPHGGIGEPGEHR